MTYFRPITNKKHDSGNSSTTPLLASAVFTGSWIEVSDYSEVIISILTDQDSAANGLRIESSLNGSTVSHYHTFSPLVNTPGGHHYASTLDSKYLRIVYTNGSTDQTTFNITSTLFSNPPEEGHVHSLEYAIESDHQASINRSILVAKNPSGDYGNISRTAGGNLKVALEELETSVKEIVNIYPVGTGANGSVTLTSANTAYAVPTSAPTGSYKITIYNGSDSVLYIGYQNTNSNGIPLSQGETLESELGASQQLYAYCASASKALTYVTKLVN